MRIQDFEQDAGRLRNIYWFIRAARSGAALRRHYRRAAKEKAALRGLGWSPEVIRLYCLALKDTRREHRRYRFVDAFEEAANGPKQLSLF